MKVVKFETPAHKSIVIDACAAQTEPFDSVQIMRYIAENEIQGQTFDHHDISFYLDELHTKNFLKIIPGGYFTKYALNKGV